MNIFDKVFDVKNYIKDLKFKGHRIALVPTMGSLHEGHISLVKEAKKYADIVVVSIFVNEVQFNNKDDFNNYPKNLEDDIDKLKSCKVDIVFCPSTSDIYPEKNYIDFEIKELANNLCAKYRPGHFSGVLLIVSKLFNIIQPDFAIFGQKDFQQLQIIKKMVRDLNFDLQVIGAKTIRDENGLALSSRNKLLDPTQISWAQNINKILKDIKKQILNLKNGDFSQILNQAKIDILQFCDNVEYLEICLEDNLQIVDSFDKKLDSRIFIAVYLGKVRLIDNIKIN